MRLITTTRTRAAATIDHLASHLLGARLPVGMRTWDGSRAGPVDGPQVVVRQRRALRHLLFSPGELGLARAFVSGDLDVDGDLTEALRRCWALARECDLRQLRFGPRRWLDLARGAVRLGAVGWRPAIPQSEARLSGSLHSRGRDRLAIAHHYNFSNAFYESLLDPSMSYSCGYFATGEEDLDAAQETKLDVICRKLGLRPSMRLLDVGCGWGSLVLYAAQHYQVHTTGITLSRQQYDHVRRRIEQFGLHGRLLLQQMSRGAIAPGGGAFIESYIAPDMSMVPLWHTLQHLETAGFEVRDVEAMREHYVRTITAWATALVERRAEMVRLLGEERHRVWRLYLAGGLLAFEENRMGINQVLAVRPGNAGGSGVLPAAREAVV